MRSEALPILTSLRFVAAMYVVFYHTGYNHLREAGGPALLAQFLSNGYLGVSFFFILSGFILFHTYRGGIRGRSAIASFLLARFARIYPVYALSLLLLIEPAVAQVSLAAAAACLVLLQSWGPAHDSIGFAWNGVAWTLSIEAFFYLLFPLLLPAVARLRRTGMTAALVAVLAPIVAWRIGAIWPGQLVERVAWEPLLHVPLPVVRLPEFVFGMLLAQAFATGHPALRLVERSWQQLLIVLLIVGLLACGPRPLVPALVSPLFGAAILSAAVAKDGWMRALAWPPLVLLGGASYAIYVLQIAVTHWIAKAGPFGHDLAEPAVRLAVLLTLSVVVYIYFEEPARRRIRGAFAPTRGDSLSGLAPIGADAQVPDRGSARSWLTP